MIALDTACTPAVTCFFHKDSHYSSYVQRKSFDVLCMFWMFSRVEIKRVWNKSRAAPLSDFRQSWWCLQVQATESDVTLQGDVVLLSGWCEFTPPHLHLPPLFDSCGFVSQKFSFYKCKQVKGDASLVKTPGFQQWNFDAVWKKMSFKTWFGKLR